MLAASRDIPRVERFTALREVECYGSVIPRREEFLAIPPRRIMIGGSVNLKEPVVVCGGDFVCVPVGFAHNNGPSYGQ